MTEEIYCRKCRERTPTSRFRQTVSKKGCRIKKGICDVCDTNKHVLCGRVAKKGTGRATPKKAAPPVAVVDPVEGNGIQFPSGLTKKLAAVQHAVFKGKRTNWPPQSRKLIRKYGGMKVVPGSFKICRHPISTNKMVKAFAGLLGRKVPHDDLFHLLMIFKVEDGTELAIDKNEDMRVKLASEKYETKKDMVCKPIQYNNPKVLTFNEMIANTRARMGEKDFWRYSSFENNCQDFQLNHMAANGLTGDKDWIKQDVENLLPKWAQKLADVGTDFKNIQKLITEGVGAITYASPDSMGGSTRDLLEGMNRLRERHESGQAITSAYVGRLIDELNLTADEILTLFNHLEELLGEDTAEFVIRNVVNRDDDDDSPPPPPAHAPAPHAAAAAGIKGMSDCRARAATMRFAPGGRERFMKNCEARGGAPQDIRHATDQLVNIIEDQDEDVDDVELFENTMQSLLHELPVRHHEEFVEWVLENYPEYGWVREDFLPYMGNTENIDPNVGRGVEGNPTIDRYIADQMTGQISIKNRGNIYPTDVYMEVENGVATVGIIDPATNLPRAGVRRFRIPDQVGRYLAQIIPKSDLTAEEKRALAGTEGAISWYIDAWNRITANEPDPAPIILPTGAEGKQEDDPDGTGAKPAPPPKAGDVHVWGKTPSRKWGVNIPPRIGEPKGSGAAHPHALTNTEIEKMLKGVAEYKGHRMMNELDGMRFKKNSIWLINTDDMDNGGTHWVVAININRLPYVFYFDSYGLPPDDRIRDFLYSAQKPVMWNGSQLQHKDTITCGYFVVSMIKHIIGEKMDPYDALQTYDQQPSEANEKHAVAHALGKKTVGGAPEAKDTIIGHIEDMLEEGELSAPRLLNLLEGAPLESDETMEIFNYIEQAIGANDAQELLDQVEELWRTIPQKPKKPTSG